MTIIDKIKDLLRMLAENIHKRRRVVLALSCVVVFVTTYMLILPAFTLEKTKAAEQGGIDVPGVTTTAEDVSEDEEADEAGQADAEDAQAETGKTEDGKAEDSGSKSKDSGEAKADSAQTADSLTYEDEHYTIAVDDKNSVLPENTEIKVEEIDKNEDAKKYQKHFDDALAAIQEEKDGENVSDLEFARFYDISLVSDGKEVTLGNGDKVSVNIEYDKELRKALGVENKDNIRIIHFAENKDTGKVEAEVLDNKEAKVEVNTDKKDQLKEASFEAESFSVYAVVYTVDFEYEDEATHEVYKYSMEGGSSITLKKLAVILGITAKDKADEFIANVEDVKFSDEKLVKVENTDNGWTLKSLKAFDTTETLTITMKDGKVYEVKVTDAQTTAAITFYKFDGETIDADASIGDCYYVVINSGNNVRAVKKVSPVNGVATLDFGDVDTSGCEYTVVKYTGEGVLTPEFASEKWWHDGTNTFFKTLDFESYTFTNEGSSGEGIISFAAVKKLSYTVEIVFEGGVATNIGSGYSIYTSVKANNQSGNSVTYFNNSPVTLDGKESQSFSFSTFNRTNGNPDSVPYSTGAIDTVALVKNLQIEQNGENRGTISNGTIVKDGDVLDGFVVNITTSDDKTTYTFSKPDPYTYSVKAMDGNTEENIDFTEGPWYLYGEVTRSDGVYFYVKKIENGGEITGTVDKLERYTGVNQRQSETVPTTNDYITFALVRPKDGQSDQPGYFWTSDNMNVKALSGSSVDSKYTLEVVPGESHSDIILRKGPKAAIELTSYDENKDLESAPSLNANGSYFIVGEMSFRDGLDDKTCYYVEKVSGNQSQRVVIPNFTGKNNDIQYLTGTRSFEPVLVYDTDASATAESVMNKLINKDSSISVYRNGDPVESYRMTSVNGTLDAPEGKIKLNKLPTLSAAGEIRDKNGDITTKKDDETYNLLVEITRDGKKAYAYQQLTFGTDGKMEPVKIADSFKEATSGETWYYSEEDTPNFYVVKGSVANHNAAVASANRFAAGQLMGTYTPSFAFDEETCTVTTVLKETEEHAGTAYSVRIDMMNKAQNDVEAVTPALNQNYYVLATLTPKGTGSKGQVVAWTVLNVDEADLNADGTWSGNIPANGFNVCNANMDSTNATIGYNADDYDINLRLYHSDTAYTTYNDIREHADDSAPSGYDFRGVYTKDNDPVTGARKLTEDNASVIRLHKAYDKVYGLRAYVDNSGLDIPEGDYVVKVKLQHETGGDTYAFAKLKIDPNVGGDTPAVLDFYTDATGRIWRDQNGSLQDGSNYTFTGNEKGVELTLMSLTNGGESFAEWTKDPSSTTSYTVVKPGSSINLYTFTFGSREDEENISEEKHYVYDVLRFTEDVNGISKAELDEKLKQARDFGLYTELLSKHATDMESNIGAAVLSGEIGADYGFSGNNIKVNRITVTKQYYENGNPVSKQVTLRLYPVETYNETTKEYTLGTMVAEKQGNTDNNGVLKVEFDKLPAGKYVLKEVVNGKEYDFNYGGSTDGHIVDGNTVIQFQDRIIDIENINVNYNYFGEITDNVSLPPVLNHSRHGLIVVGNDADYNALKTANGGEEVSSEGTTVKRAGTDPNYPQLDIPADMANLRELSNLLGASANSKTVRIINTTFDEINSSNGLNLKSDGRYIVVNIDMSDAPSVATVNLDTYIDNHRLLADFGADGNEDSSKVLYNFITKDSRGNISNYDGKINTATQAAGVILAPSAIVADLGGNWGGTIICKEAQHTGSEIHSDSANKIQNKNTMLTNGNSDNGNLELIKSFADQSDDRTTWFTFKVKAKKSDNTPLSGTYTATGLKEGKFVTFDENGEATVLVRAQNKVFIVGLPDGVKYTVEEIATPETEHYSFDHATPEDGSGTIVKNTTSSVEIFNKKNTEKCDLMIVKTVVGHITAEVAKNLEFEVQVLDSEGNVTGYLDKNGNVSEESVKLKLSDGFTINTDDNGYITTALKRFPGIESGKYRVVESNYAIEGYQFISEQSVTSAETTIETGTGRVDIKDVYAESFEFTKIWKSTDDQVEDWPSGKKIAVTLYSKAEGGTEQTVDTFELDATGGTGTNYSFTGTKNADSTYTFMVTGLPSVDANGKKLTYYVKETKVDGYKDPIYGSKDSAGAIRDKTGAGAGYAEDKEYVTNKPEDAVELPHTGGIGTVIFYVLGSILVIGGGIYFISRRRAMK